MKTLLVPIDFSAASINAANYALDFAIAVKGEMILIYVCRFPVAVSEVAVPAETFTGVIDDAEKRMQELKDNLNHKASGRAKVHTEVKEGYEVGEIEHYCNTISPYAVILGLQGTGSVERVLFGSNTLQATRQLSWPIIVVPQGARFTTISKIGIACDLKKVPETVNLDAIKKIVNEFQAQLHVLNVNTEKNKMIDAEQIEGLSWLKQKLEDIKPEFHFLHDDNVDEAIRAFAEKNNLDLLIIIPKKHNFFDSLVHKSHTRNSVLHSHIPVLAVHQ